MKLDILIGKTYVSSINRSQIVPGNSEWILSDVHFNWRKPLQFFREGLAALDYMLTRAQRRKELLNLSDHILKDVGLNRDQIETEANKYFWQN